VDAEPFFSKSGQCCALSKDAVDRGMEGNTIGMVVGKIDLPEGFLPSSQAN
jgi:hypothetical protein